MEEAILMFGKQVCSKEWYVKGGYEGFHRMYYVYQGNAIYRDAKRCITLKNNYLYIFPDNNAYTIVHDPSNPIEVLWVHIDSITPLVIELFEVFIQEGELEESLIKVLEKIDNKYAIVGKIVSALLTILQEKYDMRSSYPEHINRMIRYIHTYIADNLTNETLAKLSGYNKNYMIKYFHQYIGITPKQYMIRTKMSYAKRYLVEGNNVKQTADLLGYKDVNALSRDFKKYYNQNPSYYIGKTNIIP